MRQVTYFDYPTDEGLEHDSAVCIIERETGEELVEAVWNYVVGRLPAINIDAFADMLAKDFPAVEAAIEDSAPLREMWGLLSIFNVDLSMKARLCEYYFVFANNQSNWSADLQWSLPSVTQ